MGYRIAIFASGSGTNAAKIIEHNTLKNFVKLIITNKPNAGVLNIAKQHHIETLIFEKQDFYNENICLQQLVFHKIDWIILAGFLLKIPPVLIKHYPNKIINIHPALLPKYGGKGMYGHHVHDAVLANKETETGITIHFVDEIYDHGKIIFQGKCTISEDDDVTSISKKVQQLEHQYYASTIAKTMGL